ncbi:MAG: 4Fe-4S binding protein [Candidatus Omnitrophica bacterium]|nr:4Fe-4S binding protein [Candidatus Omnitrophota bacterium]
MAQRKIIRINENKCNGCGLCIPNCPEGAIRVIDNKARLISDLFCDGLGACLGHCPQGAISIEEREAVQYNENKARVNIGKLSSGLLGLKQWPIQLCLVPTNAPYFNGADILIAADCVSFAYANFHEDLLKGKILLIGCPKLDDVSLYQEKLEQIFTQNNIKSVTYVYMEVPCCFGLLPVIEKAIGLSGKDIPFEKVIISIKGEKIK